jgi:hypothetical protein
MHLDFRVRCVVVIDVPDPDTWLVSHPGYPYLSLYLIMTLQEKSQFETWKFTKRKKARNFNWDLKIYQKVEP